MTSARAASANLLRRSILGAFVAAAVPFVALSAHAQSQGAWPTKTVRVVVGFPPGGTTDVMARLLSQGLGEQLGQTFIVENKPGASGNLSAGEVVKATPDGYTLLLAPTSVETANPSLFKTTFQPSKDLAPVAAIGRTAMYLVTKPGLEVKDAKELVALAKAKPGSLSYASAGAGTPPHLAAKLFKQQAGIFATHIPYRGAAPALQDVMASQADYVFDPGIAFPHIRTGKVKLLGVASTQRSPFFPDVPTLAEQGIQGAELDIWFGVWAPVGVPADVLTKLNAAMVKVLAQPTLKQRFADLGAIPEPLDTAAFRKLLDNEAKVLSALIKDRKISVD
jgi:tripartite-type tricarboxylate transporter receptor subunit TctC